MHPEAVHTYVVYVDEVFGENLVVDFVLLFSAAGLCRTRVRPWRLFLAAALGALAAVGLFVPEGRFLTGAAGKVAVSVVMIAVAFAPVAPGRFFLLLGSLYLAAFAAGGAALALAYFLAPAGNRWNVDLVLAGHLAPACAFVLPVLWFLVRVARHGLRHLVLDACRMDLVIHWRGRRVRVEALVDTGNCLEDPLSGHPVVVVESEAVRSLLPEGLSLALAGSGEVDLTALAGLAGSDLACRLRLIPFSALGRGGLMVGFRPDRVEITAREQSLAVREVVVGITRERFDPALNCRALIHPRLLAKIPG